MRRSIARTGFALWLAGGLATLPTSGADGRGVGITLENELGGDQEVERVTVFLDDQRVGELVVDRKRPRAQLSLPVSRLSHRYRLEGEARLGGVTYRIDGGGLIVDTARMDGIAERPATAVEAVAAYRELVAELVAAAPGADLDSVLFVPGAKAEQGAVAAAEKRLGVTLPLGYRRLVEEVGAFRLGAGSYTAGAVLAPHELATAVDFYIDTMMRDNGWEDEGELRELAARIGKRFRQANRDVVLDHFELGEPTVLVPGHRCPKGRIGVALPGSDFDLLGTDPGDNPFMALIDYDYIMGEPDCYDYDRLLAYSLHDHLLAMGDEALFVRDEETMTVSFYRARTDDESRRIWLRLTELDEEDGEED